MSKNIDDLLRLENQFNFLLRFANDIILLMDADGNLLEANDVAAQTYGWSLDELLTLNIRDLRDLSTMGDIDKQLKLTADTGALFETRHRRRDGSTFPVEVSSRLFEHDGKRYRQSIVRDISQRKRTEEELRLTALRYQLLFDSSRDALMIVTPPQWKFTGANQTTLRLFGAKSLAELSSLGPLDVSPERQQDGRLSGEKAQEMIELAMREGTHFFEWEHKRLDGKTFIADVLLTRMNIGDEVFLQATVRDISLRHHMQKKLERDAKRFEGLLKLHEQSTLLPEKEFMQYGLEWVERLTQSQIAFIHFVNEDQESIELVAWSAATKERYCTASYDNHYPVSEAGIWADCLRQRRAVIFNDYANYQDKHGLPEGHSMLVRLISVPVIEGDRVRVIIGVGNKETDYDEDDIEIARLFGNDMWRIIRRQRVETELAANLEQQRTLNKKLEEAHSQLIQSEKMASLGQLAAGVAHELNNPIGFVYSNMGTLESYLNDIFVINAAYEEAEKTVGTSCSELDHVRKIKKDKDYDYIKQDIFLLMAQSKDGLVRMRKIVQDLKDFSHVGEEGWKWVDLHNGLDSTLNIVWNELKYKCQVIKEYGTLPQVYCMASQINQVFMNMLVNAAQAIETKGVITIRTGSEKDRVWVEIEDTGKGIPAEDLHRIFDPFFTTKQVGVGTGLGLSLSYGIIQKHHGRIDVQSEVGKGTTMRIWIPVKHEAAG
jgi:PAS domain S-box-containing protein